MAKKKVDVEALKERVKEITEGKSSRTTPQEGVRTIKLGEKKTEVKTKSKVKKETEFAKAYEEKLKNCSEAIKILGLDHKDSKEVHDKLLQYITISKGDPQPLKAYLLEIKDKYKITKDKMEVILKAYSDYSSTLISMLADMTPDERMNALLSIIPESLQSAGRVALEVLEDKLQEEIKDKEDKVKPKKSRRTAIHKESIVGIIEEDGKVLEGEDLAKRFKELTGLDYDPKKHKAIVITNNEKLGIYDALLTDDPIHRDAYCEYKDKPKALAKEDLPLHQKVFERKLNCPLGKDAVLLPMFNIPTQTLILPRDEEDSPMFGIMDFKEEPPISFDGEHCELSLSRYYMEESPYANDDVKDRSLMYHFPWRFDSFLDAPAVCSEEAFDAIAMAMINDTDMPLDDSALSSAHVDASHNIDNAFTVAGTHLHTQLLKSLAKYRVPKEELEATIVERCATSEYFQPIIIANHKKGNVLEDVKYNILNATLRTMAGDVGLLLSLGIIDPYNSLTLVLDNLDRPALSRVAFTPLDMDKEERDIVISAEKLSRFTTYPVDIRAGLASYIETMMPAMVEHVKSVNGKVTGRRDIVKYAYNFLYTFNVAYIIDPETIERIKIAIDVFKKAKKGAYENFFFDNKGIDIVINFLEEFLNPNSKALSPSTRNDGIKMFVTANTYTTRAMGVGIGTIQHTFTGNRVVPKSEVKETKKTRKVTKVTKTKEAKETKSKTEVKKKTKTTGVKTTKEKK